MQAHSSIHVQSNQSVWISHWLWWLQWQENLHVRKNNHTHLPSVPHSVLVYVWNTIWDIISQGRVGPAKLRKFQRSQKTNPTLKMDFIYSSKRNGTNRHLCMYMYTRVDYKWVGDILIEGVFLWFQKVSWNDESFTLIRERQCAPHHPMTSSQEVYLLSRHSPWEPW